jgi:hypothetical protein
VWLARPVPSLRSASSVERSECGHAPGCCATTHHLFAASRRMRAIAAHAPRGRSR